MPYAELNSLYRYVLSKVRGIERVLQVLGLLVIYNPDQVNASEVVHTRDRMDEFLFWTPGETEACLNQLASVIECDEDGEIHFLHASLEDFLRDPSRSHQFYLCRESVLTNIALLGLRHMSLGHDGGVSLPFLVEILARAKLWCVHIGGIDLAYFGITTHCIENLPARSSALLRGLSQIPLLNLYSFVNHGYARAFWAFMSSVFDKYDSKVSRDGSSSNIGTFTNVPAGSRGNIS